MTTLHMETDTVRAMAGQLKQVAETLRSQTQLLNASAQSVDWLGPSRDEFVMETDGISRQLDAQVEVGTVLAGRIEAEVVEWENMTLSGSMAFLGIEGIVSDISESYQIYQARREFKLWWKSLSDDEKINYLREQNTKIASQYGIESDEIIFVDLEDKDGKDARGWHNGNTIAIDIDNLRNDDPDKLLGTIAHETRHGMQEHAINQFERDGTVPAYTNVDEVKKWQSSWGDNYIDPNKNFKAYEKQSVEVDARDFGDKYVKDTLKNKRWKTSLQDTVQPDYSIYA